MKPRVPKIAVEITRSFRLTPKWDESEGPLCFEESEYNADIKISTKRIKCISEIY